MGISIHTAESRAAVGTEFLSPYPPHTHTHEFLTTRIPIPTADLVVKDRVSVRVWGLGHGY